MEYKKTVLRQALRVSHVISVHYFEYAADFAFSSELHDFWEFVYADKGSLVITAGARELNLSQGQMYIHPPMEFHNLRSGGAVAPNSVIVTFSCDCGRLYELTGRLIICSEEAKKHMGAIIAEARHAFCTPLGDPYTTRLVRNREQPFGCEQMIRLHLEMLLIELIRENSAGQRPSQASKPVMGRCEKLFEDVCRHLCETDGIQSSTAEICRRFSISESALQKLFRAKMGCGVMQYCQRLKIDAAKRLIRQKRMNFTEIAESLGYSSIHYFSRHFKKQTGMTPTQYADSVKAMSGSPAHTNADL